MIKNYFSSKSNSNSPEQFILNFIKVLHSETEISNKLRAMLFEHPKNNNSLTTSIKIHNL